MVFINNVLRLGWFVDNIKGFWVLIWTLLAFSICLLFENNYRKLKSNSFVMAIITSIIFVWGIICLSGESAFVYFNF